MRDVAFGQYYPADSIIHRLDPRSKLIALIIFMVAVFFCQSFFSFGFLTLAILICCFISRVPFLKIIKSLKMVIWLVLFTAVLTTLFYRDTTVEPIASWWIFRIYLDAIYTSAKLAWRLLILVLAPALLTLTSTPTELTDGLESLLKPLKLIKVPVHELALIMNIALRMVPTLIDETDKIINAQKSRGANFDSRNPFKKLFAMITIIIPLFISAFLRAMELADAMEARCFKGASNRTRMRQLHFGLKDVVTLLIFAVLLVCVLFLKYNWLNWAFIPLLGI